MILIPYSLALRKNLIYVANDKIYDVQGRTESPYLNHTAFIAAPLGNQRPFVGSISFGFNRSLFLTNREEEEIEYLEVDFGDGQGTRNIDWDSKVTVNYEDAGIKTFVIIAHLRNSETLYAYTSIIVYNEPEKLAGVMGACDIDSFAVIGLPFNHSQYYGNPASNNIITSTGKAFIYYADGNCTDKVIKKPVIFLDGFEAANDRKHVEIYKDYLNNDRKGLMLGNDFRRDGYDIIIFDFDNGGALIESNALAVVNLLTELYSRYQNTLEDDFVIIGPSMSGVVAQYALAYAEKNCIPHHTRLFISFDGAHQGANIPIGLQQLIGFVQTSNLLAQPCQGYNCPPETSMENVPAARQMLQHHYLANQEVPTPHSWRNTFVANLRALGYPKECRNVAIVNGSKKAITQPGLNPTNEILKLRLKFDVIGAQIDLIRWKMFASPGIGRSKTFDAYTWKRLADKVGLSSDYEEFAQPGNNNVCLDNIAGGYKATMKLLSETVNTMDPVSAPIATVPVRTDFGYTVMHHLAITLYPGRNIQAITNQFNHTFISTSSAVDLFQVNGPQPAYNFENEDIAASGKSPFDAVYAPDINEEHVELTAQNAAWFENEIKNQAPLIYLPTTLTGNFNFGLKSLQRVISSVDINGGNLYINNSTVPIDNNGTLAQSGHLAIHVACSKVVRANTGGTFYVGNGPTHTATVSFRPGSILDLNGGKLVIDNNSKVIIEAGATLLMSQNSVIELNGDNAVLEIKGNLTVGPNTTFTFTALPNLNTGFVKFTRSNNIQPTISVTNTSHLKFEGRGITDKILELDYGTVVNYSTWNMASSEFRNGLIEMGGHSKIYLVHNVIVNNAHFEGDRDINNLNSKPGYTTVECWAHTDIERITNSKFTGGQTGFTSVLWTGLLFKMSNNTFSDCNIGFRGVNSHIDFNSCTFTGNTTGWKMDGGGTASVKNCNFTNNLNGIEYNASNSGIFNLENSGVANNKGSGYVLGYGLKILGPATLKGKCSYFSANDIGARLQYNSYLDLSGNNSVVPQFRFYNYYHNIKFEEANGLNLNNGYNFFRCFDYESYYNTGSSPYSTAGISGELNGDLMESSSPLYHPYTQHFPANNNWWNLESPATLVGATTINPSIRFDYSLFVKTGSYQHPVFYFYHLADNSPNPPSEPFYGCDEEQDPGPGSGGSRLSSGATKANSNHPNSLSRQSPGSAPSMSMIDLKNAIQQALTLRTYTNPTGSDQQALAALHTAFLTASPDTSQADKEVLDEAYRLMRQVYAASLITDITSLPTAKLSLMNYATDKVINWQQQIGNNRGLYYSWMNKVLDTYSAGEILQARSYLPYAFPLADSANQSYAQYWNCFITANIMFKDSTINSQQFFAMLDSCSGFNTPPVLNRQTAFKKQKESKQKPVTEEKLLLVYPNPSATGEAMLSYELKQDDEITVELLDVKGNVVKTVQKQSKQKAGTHEVAISIHGRAGGLYLARVYGRHFNKQAKLVYQK